MPVYDYQCDKCKKIEKDVIAKIIEERLPCECGSVMRRLMSCTHGINMGVGSYGYYDETLGKGIGTNKQLREEMRKQGVTKKGDTPKNGGAWY